MNRRRFLAAGLGGLVLSARKVFAGGKTITLPDGSVVSTSDHISPHFTWGEVTHGGERVPPTLEGLANVKRAAGFMEEIREKVFAGGLISVTSWYRDPETNERLIKEALAQRAAGKNVKLPARNSLHMGGNAVDFNVVGYSPAQVYQMMNAYWGSRGGLGRYNQFTHVDDRGFRARW